ncbi:hypothetical protein ACFVXH_18525 [Kitasatospora sp. NPDC058184]|uniref:hypothetical protein n=1 Tax=Kitasatospora TaxID=2063 RepID=UPI0015F2FE14|nr:hypothetical protein [Kitasatospora xanthocidica]
MREVIAQLTADVADGFAALAAGMRTLTIRDGRLVPAHAPSPSGAPCAAQS